MLLSRLPHEWGAFWSGFVRRAFAFTPPAKPEAPRADRLLHQARLALDPDARLNVVRKMYDMRFGEAAPQRRSIDQLRGIEGARVKRLYEVLARQYGVKWKGRPVRSR